MQSLDAECHDINVPLVQFKGHSLLLATTRAIKTRFVSLLVAQALHRSPAEAVIVIDPKGDLELKTLLCSEAKAAGREKDFLFFHPAFPEKSISINPLNNYSRSTELATRLVDVMKGGDKDDAFSAFAWRAINSIVNGLIYVGLEPDILLIKQTIDQGVGDLLAKGISKYKLAKESSAEQNELFQQFLLDARPISNDLKTLIPYYKDEQQAGRSENCLDDLLSFYSHNKTHASKMLANLVPLLGQLTSSSLAPLLSPVSCQCKKEKIIDMARVVSQKKIIYIGLDCMSDPIVGAAVGQILLADLAAVAAQRYNYSQDFSRVNLYIDEAHSVTNNSLLTLANQGAGAGIDLFLASQTLSDFVVALGSEEHALKLLGNLNNIICGRIIDPWTQKLISERFGKTRIDQVMKTRSESTGTGAGLLDWNSAWGERQSLEETDLVPAAVLGRLPNMEYFAMLASGSLIKGKIPVLKND